MFWCPLWTAQCVLFGLSGTCHVTRLHLPEYDSCCTGYVAGKSSGGFFDSAVGAQFAKSRHFAAPVTAAPKAAASPRASSGGGFFDSAVGAQFAKRDASPTKAAPKPAAPTASASGKSLCGYALYVDMPSNPVRACTSIKAEATMHQATMI